MILLGSIDSYRATRKRTSPNWSPRPSSVAGISMLVIHATADEGNEEGAEAWLCNPKSAASAHLHVRRDGSTTRLVPDIYQAWHAGESAWTLWHASKPVTDLNRISLGIEVANRNNGREPYTEAQYRTLADLVAHYCRQGVDPHDVVGHEQVARPKTRKTDPGQQFDWVRMRMDVYRLLYEPHLAAGSVRIHAPAPPHLEPITVPRPGPKQEPSMTETAGFWDCLRRELGDSRLRELTEEETDEIIRCAKRALASAVPALTLEIAGKIADALI